MLEADIRSLVETSAVADRDVVRATFARLREELSSGPCARPPTRFGRIRWAGASTPGWKQGILLRLKFGICPSRLRWITDGSPSRTRTRCRPRNGAARRPDSYPAGSAIRDGAYLAPGVIWHAADVRDIGAWIGEQSLIDSHALVGSCAQIGARVHVSAGRPDRRRDRAGRRAAGDCRRRCVDWAKYRDFEGAIVKARAVIAAGTVLDRIDARLRSRQRYDIRPAPEQPLVIPENSVVVPGARA